jgi:hypothetical protein
MINLMNIGLNAQGYTTEANRDNLEEDDELFPEREDFDDRGDRLYHEQIDREINS